MTAELHQKELQTMGSYIQADAENIRALARIAEIHERRLEPLWGDHLQRLPIEGGQA